MSSRIAVVSLLLAACSSPAAGPGPTEVTVSAGDTVRHLTQVESYRIRAVEGDGLSISLLDADQRPLAALTPRRVDEAHFFFELEDDAGGSATYSVELSPAGTSFVLSGRLQSRGQLLTMETVVSEDGKIERITLGVDAALAPLVVVDDGEAAPTAPAEIEAWLQAAGIPELLGSKAARTLFLVVGDSALVEGARQVVPDTHEPSPPADGVGVSVAASHKSNTCQQLWDFVAAMAATGFATCTACAAALAAAPETAGFTAVLGLLACITCSESIYLGIQTIAICYWDEYSKKTPEACRKERTCPDWLYPTPSPDEHSCVCDCDPTECEATCRHFCADSYISSSCNSEERCRCVVQPEPPRPPEICDVETDCPGRCNQDTTSCNLDGDCDASETCATCPTDCRDGCNPGDCCSGQECGIDPDCGMDCGDCGAGEECVGGSCQCIPCLGRSCGTDYACGGIACGSCAPSWECDDVLGVCTLVTTGGCAGPMYCTECGGDEWCECDIFAGPPWCACCYTSASAASMGCDTVCSLEECGWLPNGCGGFMYCGDCSASPWCGNGACDGGESCDSCPFDCGCSPGSTCPDGLCDLDLESCSSCPDDCGPCPTCPNGSCDAGESCATCSADCPCPAGSVCSAVSGTCAPTGGPCGDGSCEPGVENCLDCPGDCPCPAGDVCVAPGWCQPSDPCGDGACEPGVENCLNCPGDCPCPAGDTCVAPGWCQTPDPCGDGSCEPGVENCLDCPGDCPCGAHTTCVAGTCVTYCGNGTCEPFVEDNCNCPADCPPVCGNGRCDCEESCATCPGECGSCGPVCSDGSCDPGEDCSSCPDDCGACPTCPDGACEPGVENCRNCPGDCPCPAGDVCVAGRCQAPDPCGDGACEPGVENCLNCPGDCPCWMPGTRCEAGMCVAYCGNGTCEPFDEDNCNCPTDCPPVCGNGTCDCEESCATCPDECGSCGPICGDGSCDPGEDCPSCPEDCGPAPCPV